MKVSELLPGDRFFVPGIQLHLELVRLSGSAALVRPVERVVRQFVEHGRREIRFRARQKTFMVSMGTEVRRAP